MFGEKINVAFFGTPDFVVPVLESLHNNGYHINVVVTQPDKPQKRSKQPEPSPVKIFCQKQNLPCLTPKKIDAEFTSNFKKFNIDLSIVAAYGLILPDKILKLSKYGFLNIHPSLLPKYRGASPLQAALLNGDKETGISIIKMDEKMDHGPILLQKRIKIQSEDNILTLLKKTFLMGSEVLIKVMPDYLMNKITLKPQDHKTATFTKLIKKEQGKIDWRKSSQDIHNQIRAYLRWPGSYTFWEGKKLEIKKSAIYSKKEKNKIPGKVWEKKGQILVSCGCGNLEIIALKLAGKKEMSSTDFVHGHKNFIGSILK